MGDIQSNSLLQPTPGWAVGLFDSKWHLYALCQSGRGTKAVPCRQGRCRKSLRLSKMGCPLGY